MNNLIFYGFFYKILKKRDFFSKTRRGQQHKSNIVFLFNFKYLCLNYNFKDLVYFLKLYSLLSNLVKIKWLKNEETGFIK